MTNFAQPPAAPIAHSQESLEALKQILSHLERMDRRDRLRTWGGFIRSIFTIAPVIVMLMASWYTYVNFDAIMTKIATQAAEQAAKATRAGSDQVLKNFQNLLPKK